MMGFIILHTILFHYIPIYGITIAFKRYNPMAGFWTGEWVGLQYFAQFLKDPYAFRIIKNTVVLGFWSLLFGFPAPIILALLLNEVRHSGYKRSIQSITYLPHFVSTVVVVGIIFQLLKYDGALNGLITRMFGVRRDWLQEPNAFRPIYIISGLWQGVGWGTIIYLACIAGVNPELYESAEIDGAGRFRQAIYITFPSILPTVTILLILSARGLVTVGFEKAFLLQNPATYSKSDVIATYVFRRGIMNMQYSYAAAVGLLNSVVSFLILWMTNTIAKRLRGESLW